MLRNKRHQVDDGLKQYSDPYLQWLTDEEKDEIRKIIGESKSRRVNVLKGIFFYYQNLSGEEKEKAGGRLKLGCEAVIRSLVGDNRLDELQALEDDGSSMSEAMKMLSATLDKSKFVLIRPYQTVCHRIFDSRQIVRRKREYHEHSLDNYFQENLKWLSMEQKEELRKMKENDKSRADMVAKVFHYYEGLFGEAKWHVTKLLYDSCRQILKEVIGDDNYNKLVKMKDSGANMNDLKAKADAMLNEIAEEKKKERIKIYGSGCRKILASTDHKHSLEEHFKTDLKWLTKEQKDEVRKMKEENASKADIRGKILHFYKDLNEEVKKETAELLIGACNDMTVYIFDNDKATELKRMRESAGFTDEIRRKMDAMIDEIKDEAKKVKALEYSPICQGIFAEYQPKHLEHSRAHYFRTQLKWLSEAQKDEIEKMKADGKSRGEIQSKIFEFFESASGETKKHATESLLEGCHELFKTIGGEEKARELQVMMQSDLAADKIEEKITSIIDSANDQTEKAHAKVYVTPCMQLYSTRVNRQKRGSENSFHTFNLNLVT
uniref:CARD domain-containing protein n=1 Tax=Elaeophora elaphi TaxID=1147741 RepID=A0A0R3RQE8_9BILA